MINIRRIVPLMVALLLLVAAGTARAQETATGTDQFGESDALKMADEWASYVSQADTEGLEILLSNDYIHIHGTALVETKEQFLEAFRNGSRKYGPIKIEEATVRLFGSSAVVTGKFNLKAYVRGKTLEGVNRFGLMLVKRQNGQQVVSFQATPIPPQK